MDCRGVTEEVLEYMYHGLVNEGNEALVNYFKEEGIDPRKNPLEFMTYGILSVGGGGVFRNEKSETSIKGLYSAGDELTRGISAAAVFGWIAGENAAAFSKENPTRDIEPFKDKIIEKKHFIESLQGRRKGFAWLDANIALQQVMQDYAGGMRSEAMLKAGLTHLGRLKTKVLESIRPKNPFEVIRCLEVINLYELGEIICQAALQRKESRGFVRRADYPLTDPLLNDKVLVMKQTRGQPVYEWR
jgi:succinate dehydrogenase/fumarate reductase flavoprotein subunit